MYLGTSGSAKYKIVGDHVVSGQATIETGGIGVDHPYLSGVKIPAYIGAVDPNNPEWVDAVLNQVNLAGEQDTDPPGSPHGIIIRK